MIFGKKFNRYYYSDTYSEGHISVFGGSGLGKTSAVLITTLRNWHGTSFVIDISGDIYKNVSMENTIVYNPEDINSTPYNIFIYGLAEVYVRCKRNGYTRSFGSMCKQIRKRGYIKPKIRRKSYTKYERMDGRYPGDKVQVDIKYVPEECVRFPSYGDRYYQITAIDEYSRKRVLKIVKEKSTYETSKYLLELEKNMGFKIKTIQVDNGYEFVNDAEKTNRKTRFQLVAEYLGMKIKRTRPYSPWQNGKVERSHREDGKILYGRKIFRSEK
ncbi:DDE-type integrase/transposase/recombinase [Peptostreptococcus stomatis]